MEHTTTETAEKRPNKVVCGATVDPAEVEEVVGLARRRTWSKAQTAGYLIRLGLFALKNGLDVELDRQDAEASATSTEGLFLQS
jgi:hypothetical protein